MEKVKKGFKDLSSYMIVGAFLTLEVIAFLSFSLGFSYILYGVLGIALAIILTLVTIKQIKSDGIVSYIIFAYPLVIFALLTAISTYTRYYCINSILSTADIVFVPISLTVFSFIGYLLSLNKKFSISVAATVIYSALALYCAINLIATMVEFGPFYPIKYPNSKFYYGGEVSPNVKTLAYALIGFNISEVSISFYTFFPVLLLSSVVGLFIYKPKEKPYLFLAYAGFTLIAFLSLLFTINKISLISIALMVLFLALLVIYLKVKTPSIKKVYSIIFKVFVCLAILGFILIFLNAQTEWKFLSGYQNLIKSNKILNKLFNGNRIASSFNNYFINLFKFSQTDGNKFFGFVVYNPAGVIQQHSEVQASGLFLVDNLATSGVIGAILFTVFLIVGIKNVIRFFNNLEVEQSERIFLLTFVVGYFVALIMNNVFDIAIFTSLKSNYYLQGMFLIVVMLMSYAYSYQAKYKVKSKEEKQNEVQA